MELMEPFENLMKFMDPHPRKTITYIHACQVASVVSDSATPWTAVHSVPLSMGFSRHEYWSGLPCPSPGKLPDPGIEPHLSGAPRLQADSLPSEPLRKSHRTTILSRYSIYGYRPHRIENRNSNPVCTSGFIAALLTIAKG